MSFSEALEFGPFFALLTSALRGRKLELVNCVHTCNTCLIYFEIDLRGKQSSRAQRELLFFSSLLSLLELSDTKVYEPQIRARLATASRFCEVVVLKSRTVLNGPEGARCGPH